MNPQIITKEILVAMGIQLSDDEMTKLVEHTNVTLQERIGAEITTSLDDKQLEELVALQQAPADDATIAAWMQKNVPELKEIIEDERDTLLGEIAENTEAFTKG